MFMYVLGRKQVLQHILSSSGTFYPQWQLLLSILGLSLTIIFVTYTLYTVVYYYTLHILFKFIYLISCFRLFKVVLLYVKKIVIVLIITFFHILMFKFCPIYFFVSIVTLDVPSAHLYVLYTVSCFLWQFSYIITWSLPWLSPAIEECEIEECEIEECEIEECENRRVWDRRMWK